MTFWGVVGAWFAWNVVAPALGILLLFVVIGVLFLWANRT